MAEGQSGAGHEAAVGGGGERAADGGPAADREQGQGVRAAVAAPPGPEAEQGRPSDEAPGTAAPGRLNFFMLGFTGALGVFAAWLLFQAIVVAQAIFVYILVALFFAVGLNPIVEWLRGRGIPRWGGIVALCVGLIAFVVGFIWAIVPPLTEQVTDFVTQVPHYAAQLQDNRLIADLDQRFGLLKRFESVVTDPNVGQQVFGGVFGFGQAVLNSLIATFTVLVLTLFFMASLPGIAEVGYRLVPRSRRAGVRAIGDEIIVRIGSYIGGQLLTALISGVVALVFLFLIGSDYALTLALVVAVTALIPLIGTTLGALVCTVAVGVGDLFLGAVTLVFFIVYQQIESYVISPRIMRHAVDVAPTATITAALLGGAVMGLIGALIAIPVAAAVTLVLKEVVFPRLEER
ncbi:putative PurR-regulated permease PerM [Nocardiopsis mwathae]|uniref:Putative PurR-regulated permease PerM n=1 Tax=Nocardiopsis mwathae TaxID=1472723 RepID=A0A7W9YFT9_9ACTN|nr:putative PurR-regulated permease PerM [Nocardiopsis mwathae]